MQMDIVAHRAGAALAPENTLAAVEQALELGVDGIEIDVQQTLDGEWVVFHDTQVDRTTNGHGYLRDYSLSSLKQLDAGSWYDSKYIGERVPTLEEVIQLVAGRTKLWIDLKMSDVDRVAIGRLVRIFDDYECIEDIRIGSPDVNLLKYLRCIHSEVQLVQLAISPWAQLYDSPANIYSLWWWGAWCYRFLAKLFRNKSQLQVWTVDSTAVARLCAHAGAESIVTNSPSRFLSYPQL